MLADLLRIRRWAVDVKTIGFPPYVASRHLTEAAARRRRDHINSLAVAKLGFSLATVRHLARPVRGLADPHADARHRAPGRPA